MSGYSLRDRTAPAQRTAPVESLQGPSPEARSAHQRIVLSILASAPALGWSDESIDACARHRGYSEREVSASSLRSRRSSLFELGDVIRVGYGTNAKGNRTALWALAPVALVQPPMFEEAS